MGVTLGNGSQFPKEMMILTMSIKKKNGSATDLLKKHSEIPVAFPRTSFMRYAYYSNNGINFLPMEYNGTHDVQQWPAGINNSRQGKVVMLSNINNAHTNPSSGTGMAFYSHKKTWLIVGRRPTVTSGNLTLIGTLGEINDRLIEDTNWHTLVRVMAVGNLNSIKSSINKANQKIPSWGNWY